MTDRIITKFLNFVGINGNIKDNTKGIVPVRYKDMGDGTFAEVLALSADGEAHIGSISGESSYIDIALALDTNAYTSGDILFIPTNIPAAMRAINKRGVLQSIVVIDEDDQGVAMDLVFMSANQSLGIINVAPSITDAAARDILGIVNINTSDYVDLGGVRIASKNGIAMVVKPLTGGNNIYVAGITRGTPTHTAGGVRLRLGFLQD